MLFVTMTMIVLLTKRLYTFDTVIATCTNSDETYIIYPYTLSTYTMVMFMFPLQNPVYKLCPRPLLAAGPGVGDRPGDGRGHAAAGRGGTQLRTPVTT